MKTADQRLAIVGTDLAAIELRILASQITNDTVVINAKAPFKRNHASKLCTFARFYGASPAKQAALLS